MQLVAAVGLSRDTTQGRGKARITVSSVHVVSEVGNVEHALEVGLARQH
jgi:hypothetical protein